MGRSGSRLPQSCTQRAEDPENRDRSERLKQRIAPRGVGAVRLATNWLRGAGIRNGPHACL